MKLLVLAQTPPPLHGQSLMVQALLDGLPARQIAVAHVPLALSRDAADIGRWRPGKALATLRAGLHARRVARQENYDALYYIPAPGKRGALWRDLLVLSLARPACPRLVLHWHASGLGAWLDNHAAAPERRLALSRLGRADLAIVLGEALRDDAARFAPRQLAVVPNGIADPCPDFVRAPATAGQPLRALFLGLCSAEKGLFAAAEAMLLANRRAGASPAAPAFALTAAGAFASAAESRRFRELAALTPKVLRHVGVVSGATKHTLLAESDCLCFPTAYPHEAQPLVVLEALAYDLPVIATRWRAIPESLPADYPHLVATPSPEAIADRLLALASSPSVPGTLRSHFLTHHTADRWLDNLAAALAQLAHTQSGRPAGEPAQSGTHGIPASR
ncbi:MAG: glycosyltransferase family 4 protein [Opitutae bacterium]|nr:glycosyltransferase family 4 protein [Opitutae bacterium]